ncbi:PCI domain-containing protein [Priestia megaterium]|uniref:PCI domain-containing protein n=1 Tax=Priestia megaterium TaxID=1404 RepID=UPI0030C90B4A
MDKEMLYQRVHTMIISSTKEPKYMALSTVKIADLFRVKPEEIEKTLLELINEGRLKKDKLPDQPNYEIYLLP